MFSNTNNVQCSHNIQCEEKLTKWRGLFVKSLQQVQLQVHPLLHVQQEALLYIEELIYRLLDTLCVSQPHCVQDVEDRVLKAFPHPIDKWAIQDAQNATDKGKKKTPHVLPAEKVHNLLKEVLGYKVDFQVTLYINAVLEYIAADILKLTGNYVKNIQHQEISRQDITVAMCADKVLMYMFFEEEDESWNIYEDLPPISINDDIAKYEDIVRRMLHDERQYLRDLNMIVKVFRAPFAQLFPRSKDLDVIFSNIHEVKDFTMHLISCLEDAFEMAEDPPPLVGSLFEELAEGAEFDVYDKYADDILNPSGKDRLDTLMQRNDTYTKLNSNPHGFKDAVKYVLPKLLLAPIYHCFYYFDVIKKLMNKSTNGDDRLILETANGILHQLKVRIEDKLTKSKIKRNSSTLSLQFWLQGDRQLAVSKMKELQNSLDGWENKDVGPSCNKFLMEGVLSKFSRGNWVDRYVFLFDNVIIFAKQNLKRTSVSGPQGEYKLKEKIPMRIVEIVSDSDDKNSNLCEYPLSFELKLREHPSITLLAKSAEEKSNWMAAFVALLTRSTLERMLDKALFEEDLKQPLRLPPVEEYPFAEIDSDKNIVFEENRHGSSSECPVIKGGSLIKLVERLTYHKHPDPKFVKTFLTTYRSFCQPNELLSLLVKRYNIPDLVSQTSGLVDEENVHAREDLKRFRNEYCTPVQIRVLNVFRHWVDQHWYDFERDSSLRHALLSFLSSVKGKAMKKYVKSIETVFSRKTDSQNSKRNISMSKPPPAYEYHLLNEEIDIMTLHPIEIARQVTLVEFDLYCAVKPSELVGTPWIKKDKKAQSPNLLRMIHHSTMFTFWLEKCILEAEHFEERVMVTARCIEIMLVFLEWNNFNGVLEVVAALNSAPVYRLTHTFEEIKHKFHRLYKAFEEANELNSDHYKLYIEKLRSINPPCVPFLGMYLTNILLTEEGNPDLLPNHAEGIINFSKRRKVAEITQEIQQYQDQPYSLKIESNIRTFIENLNPLEEQNNTEQEFTEYLYSKSLELEPRNERGPSKFPRKRSYALKSPGIKAQSTRHSSVTLRNSSNSFSSISNSIVSSIDKSHLSTADEEDSISIGPSPPTPSTPISPTGNESQTPVFSDAYSGKDINGGPIPSPGISSICSSDSVAFPLPPPDSHNEPSDSPPPLPPRRKREASLGACSELSPIRQVPEVPSIAQTLNINNVEGRPPPLPPRRLEQSSGYIHLARPPTSRVSKTLPRHYSDREFVNTSNLNVNGERQSSITPELPPKTYKTQHSRKQST